MRRRLLLLATLAMATGCVDPAVRGRYQAEKARYWAEREDIRFALESNPQLRAGYFASGVRHAAVADRADPTQWPGGTPEVLVDLAEIEGRARIQSGVAFLRAGRMDQADPQLRAAMDRAPARYAREAAWLLGKGYEELEDYAAADAAYRDVFRRILSGPVDLEPTEQLLAIPVQFARILAEAGEDQRLATWIPWARETYGQIARRWEGRPPAHRARFLVYRLAVAAEDWPRAVEDLLAFEATAPTPLDATRARVNRAQILAGPLGDREAALELYRNLEESTEAPAIAALASLRLAEMELLSGSDPDAAVAALEEVAERYSNLAEIAAEAQIRLAEVLADKARWAEALQAYRHVQVQYPDAVASLRVPRAILEIHRARGLEDRVRMARRDAVTAYRRVLSAHPGDSQLGVVARQYLVEVLVEMGQADEALQELDQLYHLRGRSLDGMRALLEAARIADEELDSPALARRYLERVVEEMPGSPVAAEAQRRLEALAR